MKLETKGCAQLQDATLVETLKEILDDVTLDLGDGDLIEYTRMRSKFEELIVIDEKKNSSALLTDEGFDQRVRSLRCINFYIKYLI